MSTLSSDFAKYRDMTPGFISDEKVSALIAQHKGDPNGIARAIEDMWNNLPDSIAIHAVGEWDMPSNERRKAKKKSEPAAPQHSRRKDDERVAKDPQFKPSRPKSQAPYAEAAAPEMTGGWGAAPAQMYAPAHTPVSLGQASATLWKSPLTMAERLKQQQAEQELAQVNAAREAEEQEKQIDELPPAQLEGDAEATTDETEEEGAQGRRTDASAKESDRSDSSAESDTLPTTHEDVPAAVPAIITLSELESGIAHSDTPPGFFGEPSTAEPDTPPPAMKISTVADFASYSREEPVVEDDFQFGSIGLQDDVGEGWGSAPKPVSRLPASGAQGRPVWNKPLGSAGSGGSVQKMASAPPGLELQPQKTKHHQESNRNQQHHNQQQQQQQQQHQQQHNNNRRADGGSQQNQHYQQQQQQQHYAQSQHGNQSNRSAPMAGVDPMSMGGVMPAYGYGVPGYEGMGMAPAQFPQHYTQAVPVVQGAAAATGGQTQGGPPPGIPPAYPFNGNPYYGNQQYFYPPAQGPFYYNQPGGRGMYPAQGMPAGAMYGDYGHAAGQFEGAHYGANPGQPQQQQQQQSGGSNKGKNGGGNNGSAAAESAGHGSNGAAQPDAMHQYGAYGYPREGWMMPWGAPQMMPFTTTPPNVPQPAFTPSNPSQSGRNDGNTRAQAPGYGNRNAAGPGGNNWSS